MTFFIGAVIGALGAWLYTSERAREQAGSSVGKVRETLHTLGKTGAGPVAGVVQHVAETIDAAPLPEQLKSTASDAAVSAWVAVESVAESSPHE